MPRGEHRAIYAGNAILGEHRAVYAASAIVGEHRARWAAVALTGRHRARYGSAPVVRGEHRARYAAPDPISVRGEQRARYGSAPVVRGQHRTRWASLAAVRGEHRAGYRSDAPAGAGAVRGEHRARYYAPDTSASLIVAVAHVLLDGTTIPIRSATLYADEGSPYWQCDLELLRGSDYHRMPRDIDFTVRLFGIDFAHVVDRREMNRSMDDAGNYAATGRIAALSPACRFASPRAETISRTWDQPVMASEAAADLLGTVDWAMVDWMIPAFRLAAQDAAPLDVVRQLAEAAGGVLESRPDGTVRARPAWPVTIPAMLGTVPDHIIQDRDIFAASEAPTNDTLVNRVRILDVESAYQDRLEWIADENDPLKGEIRIYPSPWRTTLTLRHTRGTPPIYLGALAEASETVTETVEFVAGRANARDPVAALTAVVWRAADLGAVAVTPFATELAAGGETGYSLADITYTVRYLRAPASASTAADAQFVLEDGA